MSYRVNDLFYSLQGEGHHTGRAAVFVRFAGCNMKCSFCDTEFDSFREMTADDILQAIAPYPSRFVVLTGGEPTLQVDDALVDALHDRGYEVAMESNGTRPAPAGIDWLTVSPKGHVAVKRCNEVKVVYGGEEEPQDFGIEADHYYLQPCDVGVAEINAVITARCVAYVKSHPRWRLSLQTHKLAGFK